MRNLFLIILAILTVFSQVMAWRGTGHSSDGTRRIHWSTVVNPMHVKYTVVFRKWLKEQGLPDDEIHVDVNNWGTQKTIVQGVSGVADDLLDFHVNELAYYQSVGILENLENYPDIAAGVRSNLAYFPFISNYIVREGDVYGVPTRIHSTVLVLNLDTIEKAGMKAPDYVTDLDTFETVAREFVRRANQGKNRKEVFFVNNIALQELLHASGLSLLNETGTAAAAFDEPRKKLMDRYRRWVYEDHIIPTQAEISSLSTEASGLSSTFSLMVAGHFAAMLGGRYVAIFTRELKNPPRLGVMLPPNGGYPVTSFGLGGITLFRGSPSKERALRFIRFHLTPSYGRELVVDANGLPPQPGLFKDPELIRSSKHTNEWAFNEPFVRTLEKHSCAPEDSPFFQGTQYNRATKRFEGWSGGFLDAAAGWALFAKAVDAEIQLTVGKKPEMKKQFEVLKERQKEIDGRKARGEKLPLDWIENPFVKKYLQDTGRGV